MKIRIADYVDRILEEERNMHSNNKTALSIQFRGRCYFFNFLVDLSGMETIRISYDDL